MSAIIRRKLQSTWREAVAARFAEGAPDRLEEGLAAYDAATAVGEGEAEAAFATLSAHELLWHVDGAGFTPAEPSAPEASERHAVPSV